MFGVSSCVHLNKPKSPRQPPKPKKLKCPQARGKPQIHKNQHYTILSQFHGVETILYYPSSRRETIVFYTTHTQRTLVYYTLVNHTTLTPQHPPVCVSVSTRVYYTILSYSIPPHQKHPLYPRFTTALSYRPVRRYQMPSNAL